ncbi:hypothetical protein Y695_00049 [Hydrogenophaga sp. T4]|jgi:hypothetical protein|nr:hypothetical protein Y695_00049 [Hydrogenophaga sp. T4]
MSNDQHAVALSGFKLSASYAEYCQGVHLVPVVAYRNATGLVQWQCRDNYEQPDAFASLRQFVFNCLRYMHASTDESMDDAQSKLWVDESVRALLDPRLVHIDGVYYAIGPDNHVLILYRDDNGPLAGISRETILGLVWHLEHDQEHA